MGVRGLETFMYKYAPNACYTVSIPEEVNNYKKRNENKTVEIVVDGYSWCYHCMKITTIETITGVNVQDFFYKIEKFVRRFRNLDVKLVFFFDGKIEDKKIETYLTRRREALWNMLSAFQDLEENQTFEYINEKYEMCWVRESLLYAALKRAGCEVYHTVHDCDEEIVRYAHQHRCFAILAQDSDFIIPNIDSFVLLAKNFKLDDMTTVLCDRQKFAASIGLYVRELPLFASVLGNDVIPQEEVKEFHCLLTGTPPYKNVSYEILMPAVAKYIRNLSTFSAENVFNTISKDIFDTTSKVDLLKASYNSYQLLPFPAIRSQNANRNWIEILKSAEKLHYNFTNPNLILTILKDLRCFMGVRSENLEKINNRNKDPRFLPSSTVTRTLRQRLYGLLLREHEEYPKVTVLEWCGENVDSYKEPVRVKISKTSESHPGLLAMWRNDVDPRVKWKIFVRSISPNFVHFDRWYNFNPDFILATATLIYLFEEKYLTEKEVMVLIGTIVTANLYDRKRVGSQNLKRLDIRAVHIYTTFTITFEIVHCIFAACGFPNPAATESAYINCEPKVFHIKYKQLMKTKIKNSDQIINMLCENNMDCQRMFHQMKKIIFVNKKH